jgi:hypothetical protein
MHQLLENYETSNLVNEKRSRDILLFKGALHEINENDE